MPDKEVRFEQQSNEQLLQALIRSTDRVEHLATQFRMEELADIQQRESKLTSNQFQRLRAGIELGRRIHEAKTAYRTLFKIKGSQEAIEYCRHKFARLISDALKEESHVVTLTTKNQVIDAHHISTGTLDASLVHPREVFRPALRDAASSVILAHNHPSGDPTPSREDFAVTKRLEEAGKLLGIDVLDHIVVARDGIISIREC